MKKIWIIIVIGIVLFGASLAVSIPELKKAKVARIPIKGSITYGSYSSDPNVIDENIGKASKDPFTEAFVFPINSPGGSVVASKQVMESINDIDKPTICKIEDIGASGAYWVASACDKVVSDSLSMVGGIGVTASYLEFSGLFEKYGVDYERLVSGKYKDMGTPYKNLTEKEREKVMNKIDTIHESFVKSVSENRELNYSYIQNVSDGSVYLGKRAKDLDLVDYLGGREKVKDLLRDELDRKVRFKEYKRDRSILQMFSQVTKKRKFIGGLLSKEETVLPKLK